MHVHVYSVPATKGKLDGGSKVGQKGAMVLTHSSQLVYPTLHISQKQWVIRNIARNLQLCCVTNLGNWREITSLTSREQFEETHYLEMTLVKTNHLTSEI